MTPAEAIFGLIPDIQSNINDLKQSTMYDVTKHLKDLRIIQDFLSTYLCKAKGAITKEIICQKVHALHMQHQKLDHILFQKY